jgi:hypothetical protein
MPVVSGDEIPSLRSSAEVTPRAMTEDMVQIYA